MNRNVKGRICRYDGLVCDPLVDGANGGCYVFDFGILGDEVIYVCPRFKGKVS